jgi:hypothetical protein
LFNTFPTKLNTFINQLFQSLLAKLKKKSNGFPFNHVSAAAMTFVSDENGTIQLVFSPGNTG